MTDHHVHLTNIAFTPEQLDLLRSAVEIAFVDDDAPVYDKAGGREQVSQLRTALGMGPLMWTLSGLQDRISTLRIHGFRLETIYASRDQIKMLAGSVQSMTTVSGVRIIERLGPLTIHVRLR